MGVMILGKNTKNYIVELANDIQIQIDNQKMFEEKGMTPFLNNTEQLNKALQGIQKQFQKVLDEQELRHVGDKINIRVEIGYEPLEK